MVELDSAILFMNKIYVVKDVLNWLCRMTIGHQLFFKMG